MLLRRRIRALGALFLGCALGLLPVGCGGDDDDDAADQQALQNALGEIGRFTAVRLDTASLARDTRAGRAIRLPFQLSLEHQNGAVVQREAQLVLRNLRNPELTAFVLKDGDAGSGSSMPLPPPATYQGKVSGGGVAVFTITDDVVEGSMLVPQDGWSFIEPLEPQLRLRDVDPPTRQRLLQKFNHIIYNTSEANGSSSIDDNSNNMPASTGSAPPPAPLVMSIVADGDAALFRAYPLNSVMPFWLKQETILNAIDWLYNCVEPDANEHNAYAECGNDFDGGSGDFQAQVRIDRFEVWTTGGPQGRIREDVLYQTASMTHQASPLCCGPPHTAGESNLVHFFSGTVFENGAGVAYGIGGLNYYGPLCSDTSIISKCHHALSQIVPGHIPAHVFHGTAFYQWSIVAHEIGHNINAPDLRASPVCWLFDQQCGRGLMVTEGGFSELNLFLYTPDIAERFMAPLIAEQLGSASGAARVDP